MDASKKVKKLKFGLSTPEDIIAYTVCNITSTESFENGQPKFGGLFDLRMGTIDKDKPCLTCRQSRLYCVSHFGRIELAKKCYWPQNIPTIIQVFQVACLTCKHILDPSCEKFKNKKKNNKLLSAVQKQCSKIKICMRHTSTTMLTGRVVDGSFEPGCYEDDEDGEYLKKCANGKNKCVCEDDVECTCVPNWLPRALPKGWLSCETFPVDQTVTEMEYKVPCNTPVPRFKRENLTLIKTVNDVEDVILASTCEELLKSIDREVFEIVGINPDKVTGLICSVLPVIPPAGRPSVHNGHQRSEDDLTFKYGEIVKANNKLQVMMVQTDNKIELIHEKMNEINKYDGQEDLTPEEKTEFKKMKKRNKKLVEEIDKCNLILNDYHGHLQYHIFTLINNNMPGIPPAHQRSGRPLNSIMGRISGKEGRARNNLMGKRVDFSARTVIDGDPMISIGDVGVPFEIAMTLTFPDTINEYNEQFLRLCVTNGPDVHPGANFIFLRRGGKEFRKNLKQIEKKILFPFETELTSSGPNDDFIVLRYGDVVERHLINGDISLMNRQPSLHRMSIMGHTVVVMKGKSLRLNPDACNPYNADFDGDEMNLHMPISSVTQYEAKNVMSVKNHFISPQSNRPCMGATMDTALGLRMFVRETVLLGKYEVLDLMSNVKSFDGNLPNPVDRENMLWNGLQIFSLLLPDINYYERDDNGDICTLIKAGKFVRGIVNKRMVGTGSRGLVQIIVNDHGGERAQLFFNDIHQLVNKWMMTIGFSVGISDVIPDRYTDRKVEYNIETAKTFVSNTIQQMSAMDHVETEDIIRSDFESKVIQCLNIVRDSSGGIASKNLTDANSIKQMVSISKGSFINVSQIMASVGQQNVSHNKTTGRVPDYYEGRPLPHVEKYDLSPEARGFVEDSYKTGLTALEFFFHAMAGREGMIDTSIKTAETGYIQRQLVKILEDIVICYDLVVRNETGHLTEYLCGGDGLDPCSIEKQPIPSYMKDMKVFETTFKCMEDGEFVNEQEYAELLRLKKIFEDDYFYKEHVSLPINIPRIIKNTKNQTSKKKTECDMDPETVFDMLTMFCEELDLYVNRNNPLMTDMNYHATMLFRIIIHMELSYSIISKNNIDYDTLTEILTYIKDKFYKSVFHPGGSAGVITAQSLGEPVMQCTLNSFHHTGMATKQVTNGVVRIKELITLSKKPKNTSMEVFFNNLNESEITTYNKQFEYTYMGDIIVQTKIFYDPDIMNSTLDEADWMKYDYSMFNASCEDINYSMYMIRVEICSFEMFNRSLSMYYIYNQLKTTHSKKNLHIMFTDDNEERLFMYIRYSKNCTFKEITALLGTISTTIVCGINGVDRSYVKKDVKHVFENGTLVDKEEITVETEGSNLKYVLGLPYVDSTRTISDDLNEVIEVFGIFAGAKILHKEQNIVLENAGISIDHRHFELLSKAMICSGTFLPVNRHGSKKGSKGPVSRLTFEETSGEVTKAAIHDEVDNMTGVSANIIMAQLPPLGTGVCDIAIDLDMVEQIDAKDDDDRKTTLPVLFRNEKTKMIGFRISQLENGAQTHIRQLDFPKPEMFTTENIALLELERNTIPLKIIRNLSGGKKEYWKTSEFETIV